LFPQMKEGLGPAPQDGSAKGRNVAEQVHVDRPALPAQLAIGGLHPQLLPQLAQSTMPTRNGSCIKATEGLAATQSVELTKERQPARQAVP